ncbi:MAG: hypothetical protein ACFFDQ_13895 [Candidatus Thorarchaeota archaeon]
MDLKEIINQTERILNIAVNVDSQYHAKNLRKEADEIKKRVKKIKEVTIEDAILVHELLEKLEKTYRSIDVSFEILALFGIEEQLRKLMEAQSEVFMDGNISRVRDSLNLPTPHEQEILRFNIELQGRPVPPKRTFVYDIISTPSEISLPVLRFEGLAKLDPELLCLDLTGGKMPLDNMYALGKVLEYSKFQTIPLSMISEAKIREERHPVYDMDFEFMIFSPILDITRKQLRKFWKDTVVLDYHPIEEFQIHGKIKKLKGESEEEFQLKKTKILDLLKQRQQQEIDDIGWTVSYLRFLGSQFPPILRGKILPLGVISPPSLELNSTPITQEKYMETLFDKFDEDNIRVHKDMAGDIPVQWGTTVITTERTVLTGVPIPLIPSNETLTATCIGLVGQLAGVSRDIMKQFTKNALICANRNVKSDYFKIVFPILITDHVESGAKEWVLNNIEKTMRTMTIPCIVDISNNEAHYCSQAGFYARSLFNNAKLFIERYLIMNEMRYKPKGYQMAEHPEIPRKTANSDKFGVMVGSTGVIECPYCTERFIYKESEIMDSSIRCKGCQRDFKTPLE